MFIFSQILPQVPLSPTTGSTLKEWNHTAKLKCIISCNKWLNL